MSVVVARGIVGHSGLGMAESRLGVGEAGCLRVVVGGRGRGSSCGRTSSEWLGERVGTPCALGGAQEGHGRRVRAGLSFSVLRFVSIPRSTHMRSHTHGRRDVCRVRLASAHWPHGGETRTSGVETRQSCWGPSRSVERVESKHGQRSRNKAEHSFLRPSVKSNKPPALISATHPGENTSIPFVGPPSGHSRGKCR